MKRFRLILPFFLAILAYGLRRNLIAWMMSLTRPRNSVHIERSLMIAMNDGVRLCSDHYYPATTGRYPTIFIRSPYGRNTRSGPFGALVEFCAYRFAERGYHVILQDTRGRFDSEGEFEPFLYERQDARSTFTWLVQQPWFDGQVGMWGSSYLGIAQWVVADDPMVKALVPGLTASNLYNIIFPDGALDLSLSMRWMSLLRFQENHASWIWQAMVMLEVERNVRPAFNHLPTIQADEAMRDGKISYYQRWVDAALHDPKFPDQMRATNHQQVQAPVHLIGGWYDFFLRGMLQDYAAMKAAGHSPYLTIGPWRHVSNLFLMPTMLKPGIEWFDAHLKGKKESLRSNPVRLFVMGANKWREYMDYPPSSRQQFYYLQATKRLGDQPANGSPSHYCYDPTHPTPSVGGAQFSIWAGPRDNRRLERRTDVLTFTTEPLDNPVEFVGEVRCQLFVRSSSDFTDFCARLCDSYPDGRSINICDGLIRVEPGKGDLQPDGSLCIQIDLWATAYRFLSGHRIRLLVSSSAHPRWARHTNTAHPLTDTIVRTAEQTIYHDLDHPSALILPVTEIS